MSGKIKVKKDQVIADLVEARQLILEASSAIPAEKKDEIFLGIWSIKDLLAHLIGWDLTNRQAAQDVLLGKLPDFYAYYDHDWKSYNARLVAEHKEGSFDQLIANVKYSHQQLVDTLQSLPGEDFSKDTGVRYKGVRVVIGRLLLAEIEDERVHYEQIKQFLEIA